MVVDKKTEVFGEECVSATLSPEIPKDVFWELTRVSVGRNRH